MQTLSVTQQTEQLAHLKREHAIAYSNYRRDTEMGFLSAAQYNVQIMIEIAEKMKRLSVG